MKIDFLSQIMSGRVLSQLVKADSNGSLSKRLSWVAERCVALADSPQVPVEQRSKAMQVAFWATARGDSRTNWVSTFHGEDGVGKSYNYKESCLGSAVSIAHESLIKA